jgi:hypothetical protein
MNMNRIQKFVISTPDLVLTYSNCKLNNFRKKKHPFILESKSLITFLLASKIDLMTNKFRSLKFSAYKFILLVGGIFYLEFQKRSWLSVIIVKVNL